MDECHSDSDDEISVGCPSPRGSVASNHPQGDEDKNCSLPSQSQDSGGTGSKSSGVRSFSILDILSHCPDKVTRPSATAEHSSSSAAKLKSRRKSLETPSVTIASHNPSAGSVHFVRPWDYSHFYGFPLHPATGSPAYIPPFTLMHHHPPGVSLQSFNPRFNLNVGLTTSASATRLALSPASSASQYSDTDTDADDVSTCGSRASASPLMTSRLSHQSSANDPSALNSAPGTATTGHRNDKGSSTNKTTGNGSPLDALFQMTSKTFEGVHGSDHDGGQASQNGGLFSSRQQMKKKRKSRTAFTNHQIFELEKRFLYQKYLSPADRDEIALSLGLTNAQVITWFQNRRAKLKRDMEELKKDVESAKILASHKGFVGSMAEMTLLQKRADDYKKALSASE